MTWNLYQGLVVHASGRFVADVEIEGEKIRGLRLSETADKSSQNSHDLTGKIVFPGPLMLYLDAMTYGDDDPPATTFASVIAEGITGVMSSRVPPIAGDVLPIPLLRDPINELDSLPSLVFGKGYTAFAVNDDTLKGCLENGSIANLVRVLGHCGATLVVLSNSGKIMQEGVGGLPLISDGSRVLISPSTEGGMLQAIAIAESCGAPGNRVGISIPAALLMDCRGRAIEWWREVRRGFIQAVSVDGKSLKLGTQLLACLWRAGVKTGCVSLEELSALVCWQPAKIFGLNEKGRLYPGCDADVAIIDPEIHSGDRESTALKTNCQQSSLGSVTKLLRGGEDTISRPGRWISATPIREPI